MRKRKEKKKRSILSTFFRGIIVLLIVLLGIAFSSYTYLQSTFAKVYDNGTNGSQEVKDVKITEPVNILVYGIDDLTDDGPRRSDTMMVLHYDPKTNKILVVSIPRDTMISQSVYSYKGLGRKAKLTEVHGFESASGDLNSAATELTNVIDKTLGISIDYYVRIDYKALAAVVDAVGGVTVVPKYNMKYQEYKVASMGLVVDFNKGQEYTLNGKKAQEFLRWRKNNKDIEDGGDGSDLNRIENQRIFIKAFIDKLSSASGLTKLLPVINTASNYIGTNVPPNNILSYARAFIKIGTSNITFETLKGDTPDPSTTNGVSYFVYSPKENKEIINTLNGESGILSSFNDTSKLTVNIINANGTDGLAKYQKDKLVNNYDFTEENISTETSEKTVKESSIEVSKDIKINESDIIKVTGIKKIIYSSEQNNTDIAITIGKDYKNN